MTENPAGALRRATKLMRERAEAASANEDWGIRPWSITECSDKDAGECPCIVYQGEYKPFDQPQVPFTQYVCDAETEEHAAYIAGMHPGVALAVADWLDEVAADRHPELPAWVDDGALRIARAYLGEVPA